MERDPGEIGPQMLYNISCLNRPADGGHETYHPVRTIDKSAKSYSIVLLNGVDRCQKIVYGPDIAKVTIVFVHRRLHSGLKRDLMRIDIASRDGRKAVEIGMVHAVGGWSRGVGDRLGMWRVDCKIVRGRRKSGGARVSLQQRWTGWTKGE